MSQEKTLVVILCMHRSGSSLAARLLQRLGMSLGSFDLGETNESNKYGHFEAQPFVLLNRELQLREFDFEGDVPDSDDVLNRYRECDGRWTRHETNGDKTKGDETIVDETLSDEALARGRDLVTRLMESGTVCGFKDPRTVQAWPYWRRVFASMSELRVIPLILLRSPHEIATSIFRRSQGLRDYGQALDVTAIHFRRMKEIFDQWPGDRAVVQFDPRVGRPQLQHAAVLCGLTWSDAAFAEVYDASCRHHEAAVIDHPAQAAFDAFQGTCTGWASESVQCAADGSGGPSYDDGPESPSYQNRQRILADAAAREATLHHYRELYDSVRQERDLARSEVADLWNYIAAIKEDGASLRRFITATVPPLEARLAQTNLDLSLIQASRIWRVREALVQVMGRGRRGDAQLHSVGRRDACTTPGADNQELSSVPSCDGQEAASSASDMHHQERKDRAGH